MSKRTWRQQVDALLKRHPDAVNAAASEALKPKPKRKRRSKAQQPDADSKESRLERIFAHHWRLLGFPDLERNFRFHPKRRFELDFYHAGSRVAVEINGGIWKPKSGHSTGAGIIRDYEKLFLAQECGIALIYVPPNWLTKDKVNPTCERIWRFMQERCR